jgi:hypothetical protein
VDGGTGSRRRQRHRPLESGHPTPVSRVPRIPAVHTRWHADDPEEGPSHRLRGRESDPTTNGGDRLVAVGQRVTCGRHPDQFDEPGGRTVQVASEEAAEVTRADTGVLGQRRQRMVAGGIGGNRHDDGGHD